MLESDLFFLGSWPMKCESPEVLLHERNALRFTNEYDLPMMSDFPLRSERFINNEPKFSMIH